MNTLEALAKRKSVRGYTSQPVEQEKLETILQYGNKAPNAGPFQMTVIRNKELLQKINDITLAAMKTGDNDFLRERAAIPGYQPLYGAPVFILLSAPEGGYSQVNAACAVTNMAAVATELGLGTCYVVSALLAFQKEPNLAQKVNLPEGYVPQCGMLLGYEATEQIGGGTRTAGLGNVNFVD